MNLTNKTVQPEEVAARMEAQLRESLFELEQQFLPQLGHSQSKRLLMAAMNYPLKEEDFSGESEALIRAYGLCKNIKDALVALGVEVVIDQMLKAEYASRSEQSNEQENKEEA